MLINHLSAHLQGVCQLSALHSERLGQQRESLYLLIVGELLLQRFYAFGYHLVYLAVAAEVFS